MKYCEKLFNGLNRMADSPAGEKRLVRELAARIMALANASRMTAIKRRWRDVAARRKADRPPVWCNPVDCWNELLPEDNLVCQDPVCKELETYFKRLLIKDAIGDDTPINPYYTHKSVLDVIPANTWGLDIEHEKLDAQGAAWRYKPALRNAEDFDHLTVPRYNVNIGATAAARARLTDILGDSMPVKTSPVAGYNGFGTICSPAAHLRGMEQMMVDMCDAPELTHRLIGTICNGVINKLDAIEQSGVELIPNTDTPMFLSDPLRKNESGRYDLKDCWVQGNSQEFDQVGPEMFNEFLLEYQKRIFARFGAVCYGCCENLTRKLDAVLAIPNLRLLTCSAWTDMPALVDKARDRCCIMWRHKATDVVCPDDTAALEAQIRAQANILKGCHYQAILRELQTLMGHLDRLGEWTRLTIEAVSN